MPIWSPNTDEIRRTSAAGESSRRGETPRHILLHGTAGGSVSSNLALFEDGTRVSCNYFIGGGRTFGVVPEDLRAHTSGSPHDGGKGAQWDRESITLEILSRKTATGWTIDAEDLAEARRLVAEITARRRIPHDRDHILGHRELYERYGASYPTECPAGLDVPAFIAALATTTNNTDKDPFMSLTPAEQRRILKHLDNLNYAMSKLVLPALSRLDLARFKTDRTGKQVMASIDEFAERLEAITPKDE